MAGVKDVWEAGIKIGDKALPVSMDIVKGLFIRSNVQYKLPTFTIDLFDAGSALLKELSLEDGTPVSIVMGDGTGAVSSHSFTLLGGIRNLQTLAGGVGYTLSGILDKPKYLRGIVSSHNVGSSSLVLKALGALAGFSKFDLHDTLDAMTWLPNNTPISQYVRFVANRGWRSPSSCMMLAVNELGLMRYLDVDNIIKGPVANAFGIGAGVLRIIDTSIKNKTAFYNNMRGYGTTMIKQAVTGAIDMLAQTAVTRLSSFLGSEGAGIAGSAIQAGLGGGGIEGAAKSAAGGLLSMAEGKILQQIGSLGSRVEIQPLDCGNVHKKFTEALHQNLKIKSLYGNDVSTLIDRVSGLSLLDLAGFNPEGVPNIGGLVKAAGNYIVSGKVQAIVNGKYLEKFTLTTQGQG